MNDDEKEAYLISLGWKKVHGTGWQPNVTLTKQPLYFSLEAAFYLETDGVGIYQHSAEQVLIEERHDDDLLRQSEQEAERFKRTGVRLGKPPNY